MTQGKSHANIIQKYEEEYDDLRGEYEDLKTDYEALQKTQQEKPDLQDIKQAKEFINEILSLHGYEFIIKVISSDSIKVKKTDAVKMFYNELSKNNPSKKAKELREITAIHFNISDKAIQKHIYNSRKK